MSTDITTGPALYRESLDLAFSDPGCTCTKTCCIHEQVQLQRAQVLATLAVAAATALNGFSVEGSPQADKQAWYEAASEKAAEKRAGSAIRVRRERGGLSV